MDTDTTNLVAGDDTAADATVADDAGVEADSEVSAEPQFDDDGNPIPEPPEDEEIDVDEELKLKVPKDQAQKVREALLRQADYTRKTQELADTRKAFEAERGAYQQATVAELQVAGQIMECDRQLAQYNQVNWQQWQYDDPDAAQSAFMAWQQLKDAKGQLSGHLNQLKGQRVSAAQQEIAKRAEDTRSALAKDIPGWSEAVEAQVRDFGIKEFGFTADEMADMKIDPRIAKAFHRLHTLETQAKKNSKAQTNVQKQVVQPAENIGARSAPVTGVHDNLPIGEWMKREAARVARKRA